MKSRQCELESTVTISEIGETLVEGGMSRPAQRQRLWPFLGSFWLLQLAWLRGRGTVARQAWALHPVRLAALTGPGEGATTPGIMGGGHLRAALIGGSLQTHKQTPRAQRGGISTNRHLEVPLISRSLSIESGSTSIAFSRWMLTLSSHMRPARILFLSFSQHSARPVPDPFVPINGRRHASNNG